MKKIPSILIAFFLGLALSAGFAHYYHKKIIAELNTKLEKDISTYIKKAYKTERGYISTLATYKDFITKKKEKALRKYLLNAHLKVAAKQKLKAVKKTKDIAGFVSSGLLRSVPSGLDKKYFYYNVPKKFRYLTPTTKKGLEQLADRFQENIKLKNKNLAVVKLAVSSALRPVYYQQKLQKKNVNASTISSHSYGISFDLFYDDYFVALPGNYRKTSIEGTLKEKLRKRLGYLMGDALRRQFKAVLAKTLEEMQDEGILYAILEKNQRCYHVTILP